jgi:hypothetical protein
MRFAALVTVLFAAAPAFAQTPQAPAKDAPPPEGFYRDIPNLYDLLARPEVVGSITMIDGRRIVPTCPLLSETSDGDKALRRSDAERGRRLVQRSPGTLEPGAFSLYRDAEGKPALCSVPKQDLPAGGN